MRRKLVSASACAVAIVGALAIAQPVFAAGGFGDVFAKRTGDAITIGNDALERTFDFSKGKLSTTLIDNKLGNSKFVPGKGSEEFVIGSLVEPERLEPESPLTSVKPGASEGKGATVETSSFDAKEHAQAANAIDGDPNTYWASTGESSEPWLTVDFGREVSINSLVYTPRFAEGGYGYECTGQIYAAELLAKQGDTWVKVKDLTFKKGKDAGKQTVALDRELKTSAIRIKVTSSYFWKPDAQEKYANIAEIDLLDAQGQSLVHAGGDASDWSVETSSNQQGDGGGPEALIDGDVTTYWHSRYNENGTGTTSKMPVNVTIDRGESVAPFQTVMYRSRGISGGQPGNGSWKKFKVYASDSRDDLYSESNQLKTAQGSKTFTASYAGIQMSGEGAAMKDLYFGLEKPCDKRYVGFEVVEGQGGNFASGAEIDLMEEAFTSVEDVESPALATSDLTLEGNPAIEDVQDEIDGTAKTGKHVSFNFEPAKLGKANLDISMHVVMYDGDHFMRKWVEIESDNVSERISYIDGEHLDVSGANETWTIPVGRGGVVAMNEDRANLGQPIYVNGLFLGSEFPAADSQIVEEGSVDELGRLRYWTGKNFADLQRDNQLTKDGKYVSWQTVCGASHSDGSNRDVVQADFFDYISGISKPSDFRIQYNSWFDNMMRINDENIIESFQAVDKHLSETGVRPLDSYVIDDGWNLYRKDPGTMSSQIDKERNGFDVNKVNEDGFWTINEKFPEKFTPSSSLVHKLGSEFGVWIGPRGGYNYYGTLAQIIAEAGNGSAAGGSIDIADTRYVDLFTKMTTGWMKDYGVNYWKWDGFADDGQYGAFPMGDGVVGFDENHQHMYGGPNGVYHSTDLWEKWIGLFKDVWATADAEQIDDLWISLTCYVNPSPWYLQWASSVWMQCVGDRGEVHNGLLNDKMNTMLTYRDACYYDFIENHEFQFPLANVYNHDPIYGKEGTGITADSMNGEEFRNYLFMQGTRGTAFWELYYSDSLFDTEKWLVNADFLDWEERNFEMLRNAKWIGGTPASSTGLSSSPSTSNPGTQEAYGFSGFNAAGDEGIISMRNPAAEARTIEFTLDAGIGCTSEGTYHVVMDHAYTEDGSANAAAPETVKHGQKVSMTLAPGEVQIWHLSKKGDAKAPELVSVAFEGDDVIRVQASEHVYGAAFEVLVNGSKVEVSGDAIRAYADLKSFDIKLPASIEDGAKVEVKAVAGADAASNELSGSRSATHYAGGVIADVEAPTCNAVVSAAKRSVEGAGGFSASLLVEDAQKGTTLLSQGDQWSIGVDAEGKATFTVNGVSAVSDVVLSGVSSVTGVKEPNGMLKVYVNGEIGGSAYDRKNVDFKVAPADIVANTKAASLRDLVVCDHALGYDEVPGSPLGELIKDVEAKRPFVSADDWASAGMDRLIDEANKALESGDATLIGSAYKKLLEAYNGLVPSPQAVNVALGADVVARWAKDDSDAESNPDMPLENAVDGVKDTSTKYGEFGADGRSESSYLQVDLGSVVDVSGINLVRYYMDGRTYANTTIVLSEDEKFDSSDTVVYNADADDKNGFGAGKDDPYPETSEGRSFRVDDARARYVRVYMSGSNKGTTNHVVELEVMGIRAIEPYGIDKLDGLIARGETALENSELYTPESLDALKPVLDRAKDLSARLHKEIEDQSFTVTFGEFDAMCSELSAALSCLQLDAGEPDPVKYTVTFDYGWDGASDLTVSVPAGGTVARPVDPMRDGWKFDGWYADAALTEQFDFNAPIEGDVTVFAKWVENDDPAKPDIPVEPQEPQGPETPGGKPGSGGALPSTGDEAIATAAGLSCIAIACLGMGVAAFKRRG